MFSTNAMIFGAALKPAATFLKPSWPTGQMVGSPLDRKVTFRSRNHQAEFEWWEWQQRWSSFVTVLGIAAHESVTVLCFFFFTSTEADTLSWARLQLAASTRWMPASTQRQLCCSGVGCMPSASGSAWERRAASLQPTGVSEGAEGGVSESSFAHLKFSFPPSSHTHPSRTYQPLALAILGYSGLLFVIWFCPGH